MTPTDPKTYLWVTLCRLSGLADPGIDEMHRALRKVVGRGTVQRLKEGGTSVGVDSLHRIAEVLQVEVWQLLTPGASRENVHQLGWPFPRVQKPRWDACSPEDRAYVQAAINRALDDCEADRNREGMAA